MVCVVCLGLILVGMWKLFWVVIGVVMKFGCIIDMLMLCGCRLR